MNARINNGNESRRTNATKSLSSTSRFLHSRGSSSGNNGQGGENRADERKRKSVSTYVGLLR